MRPGRDRSKGSQRSEGREQPDELLARLDAELAEARRWRKDIDTRLTSLDRDVSALLRLAAVDSTELPFPERLTVRRFGLHSDGEEDGLTLALFQEIGIETRRFVEVGPGPNGGVCGVLAAELGWSGLMVDANEAYVATLRQRLPAERVGVVHAWVTRETIDALLREHGLTGEVDLLSIDVDGNDYWLWDALTAVSPRVVAIEYNSSFGPERSASVPYDPQFVRRGVPGVKGNLYFGASLPALAALGRRRGYRLVFVEPRGTTAYFLRDDVAPAIPEREARDAFRPFVKHARWLVDGPEGFLRKIEEAGLPLVELG